MDRSSSDGPPSEALLEHSCRPVRLVAIFDQTGSRVCRPRFSFFANDVPVPGLRGLVPCAVRFGLRGHRGFRFVPGFACGTSAPGHAAELTGL